MQAIFWGNPAGWADKKVLKFYNQPNIFKRLDTQFR